MNGILVADKPADFTSFDVIAKLRRALGTSKIGHGGTLDPMATGVLPLYIGTATKAQDMRPDKKKRYRAVVRFGIATDTGDITGRVIRTASSVPTESEIRAVLPEFLGIQQQIPPMYSAVKIEGRRLYDLARQGVEVERPARKIEIDAITLLGFDADAAELTVEVTCSRGTYIRTLAEDLAVRLGSAACLSGLRRTMSGGFTEADAISLDKILAEAEAGRASALLLPIDRIFSDWRVLELDSAATRRFLNGVPLSAEMPDGPVRVYGGEVFLATAEIRNGKLKKTAHFASVEQKNENHSGDSKRRQ